MKGSAGSSRKAGEPANPRSSAASGVSITVTSKTTPGNPTSSSAARSSATAELSWGHSGTTRSSTSMYPSSAVRADRHRGRAVGNGSTWRLSRHSLLRPKPTGKKVLGTRPDGCRRRLQFFAPSRSRRWRDVGRRIWNVPVNECLIAHAHVSCKRVPARLLGGRQIDPAFCGNKEQMKRR